MRQCLRSLMYDRSDPAILYRPSPYKQISVTLGKLVGTVQRLRNGRLALEPAPYRQDCSLVVSETSLAGS